MAFRSNRRGHIAGEDLSAYVDEELSSREVQRVYAHLQTCDDCRALETDLRATKTLVREMPLMRAPRDFTLGPEFAVAAPPARPASSYAPPRRSWFNFMPAVAMSAAVLMLLVFVDLAAVSPNSNDSAGLEVSSAARTVEDAQKQSAESAAGAAPPAAPRAGQPAPVPGGGGNTQGFGATPAPNEVRPLTAPALPPPATGGTPMAAQAAPAPAVTPFAVPQPATAPGTTAVATPAPQAAILPADEAGASADDSDDGIGLLRVLQIIAALVLAGSLGGVVWQRRRGA